MPPRTPGHQSPEPAARAAFYDPACLSSDESVGYLMRRVMSSIRTHADSELALHDLTYTQWLPLWKISRQESATVAGLARDLETDAPSMTRALDRMEAKGLVVRERSTVDRRVVQIRLTDEGRRIADLVPPVLADVLNGHLSGFTRDEWQLLLRLLRRMLANGEALRQQRSANMD